MNTVVPGSVVGHCKNPGQQIAACRRRRLGPVPFEQQVLPRRIIPTDNQPQRRLTANKRIGEKHATFRLGMRTASGSPGRPERRAKSLNAVRENRALPSRERGESWHLYYPHTPLPISPHLHLLPLHWPLSPLSSRTVLHQRITMPHPYSPSTFMSAPTSGSCLRNHGWTAWWSRRGMGTCR